MKTQEELKKELREIVNKKIPKRLKLEFGCEIFFEKTGKDLIIGTTFSMIKTLKGVQTNRVSVKSNRYKVLGKPVSLQEILLIINNNLNLNISFGGAPHIEPTLAIVRMEDGKSVVRINLTKEIEDQEPEVLQKLIDLIK